MKSVPIRDSDIDLRTLKTTAGLHECIIKRLLMATVKDSGAVKEIGGDGRPIIFCGKRESLYHPKSDLRVRMLTWIKYYSFKIYMYY